MSWKVCHATAFEPEAYLVKGFLEHQGIPCLLESGRFGMDPVRIGSLGTIRILVPEEWVPVASKLISRRTHASGSARRATAVPAPRAGDRGRLPRRRRRSPHAPQAAAMRRHERRRRRPRRPHARSRARPAQRPPRASRRSPTWRSRRSTRPTTSPAATPRSTSAAPASSPTRAASTRRCTAAARGRCGSSPASAPPRDTNERFHFPPGAGTDRALDRLRHADAHGLRRRPRARARRGRA